MGQKIFNYVVGIIFTIIGILHLVRSILGWPAEIGGINITISISVVAFIIAFLLAYTAFSLARKDNNKENKEFEEIQDSEVNAS